MSDKMYRIEVHVNSLGQAPGYLRDSLRKRFLEFPDKTVIVSVYEKKMKRSTQFNAYLWAHVYDVIMKVSWHTKQELHNTYKEMFLKYESVEVIDFKTGEIKLIERPRSSANLKTDEFATFVEQIKAHAGAFFGCAFDNMDWWTKEHPDEVRVYGYKKRDA